MLRPLPMVLQFLESPEMRDTEKGELSKFYELIWTDGSSLLGLGKYPWKYMPMCGHQKTPASSRGQEIGVTLTKALGQGAKFQLLYWEICCWATSCMWQHMENLGTRSSKPWTQTVLFNFLLAGWELRWWRERGSQPPWRPAACW